MSSSVVFVVLWAALAAQQAQSLPPALTFEQLVRAIPQAPPAANGRDTAAQEIRVRWNLPSGVQATSPPSAAVLANSTFAVVERRQGAGALPAERHPELAADRLVIVGSDASGAIVSWSIAANPLVIRAEFPGPDNVLSGQVLYRTTADLLAVLPDSPEIVGGGVYLPTWTGTEWSLTLAGSFALGVTP
jgi:hypothetical protein